MRFLTDCSPASPFWTAAAKGKAPIAEWTFQKRSIGSNIPLMEMPIPTLDRSSKAGLYRQVVESIESAILRGELLPGARLPSERDLARRLHVSRTTVVNAYKELEARGLARGYVGRGTFVAAGPQQEGGSFAWRGKVSLAAMRTVDPTLRWLARTVSDPNVISFAAALPALDHFPLDAFADATQALLKQGAERTLSLCPTEGHPALRGELAAHFGVPMEQVLVLSGAQQGLDLITRCLLDPGDAVIMERPGYVGAIQTFRAVGAHIVGWDVERADLDELEDLIVRYRPKLLYVNPTFQNPTGAVMPLGTRRALLELATRYRLPIVEDEPYRDLWFERPPPPALVNLDLHQVVIHLGTFSKTLASGLRVGWITAAAEIVDQLALLKQRCDVSSASLEQQVVSHLLRHGHFDRHMQALRVEHRRRYEAMQAALREHLPPGTLTWSPVNGGLYLWGRFGRGIEGHELLLRAAPAGVVFLNGEAFYPDGLGRHELRLCFSSQPPPRITDGIRRLARLV